MTDDGFVEHYQPPERSAAIMEHIFLLTLQIFLPLDAPGDRVLAGSNRPRHNLLPQFKAACLRYGVDRAYL